MAVSRRDAETFMLWDGSHLWGLLLWRALVRLHPSARLLRAADAPCELSRARAGARLYVPGGAAWRKVSALGPAGVAAVRAFIRQGGRYVGFCGGAGTALADGGLALTTRSRATFPDPAGHLASGGVRLALSPSPWTPPGVEEIEACVWWPAAISPKGDGGEQVVGRYLGPGSDFRMQGEGPDDAGAGAGHQGVEGGWPCVLAGRFGQGDFFLSSAHLETPASPEANAWLAFLAGDEAFSRAGLPEWTVFGPKARRGRVNEFASGCDLLGEVIDLGRTLGLLALRRPWLLAWRRGLPGAELSSLAAMLDAAARLETLAPKPGRRLERQHLLAGVEGFCRRLEGFLRSLAEVSPGSPWPKALVFERELLFGPRPRGGGLCGGLLSSLEVLLAAGHENT